MPQYLFTRRFVIIGCYLPPSMDRQRSEDCMQFVSDMVHEAKRSFDSPHLLVAGDFNQFRIEEALREHQDMEECLLGPTRGDRSIDRTFTNIKSHTGIIEARVIAALQPDRVAAGSDSDHQVTFFRALVPGLGHNPWVSHTF